MRIAYFDFNNNFGGAPQSMVHLAERLAAEDEGFQVNSTNRRRGRNAIRHDDRHGFTKGRISG